MHARRIYLDHNARSPLRPEVREAMEAVQASAWGNPSSVHAEGQTARALMERARSEVAAALGVTPSEIVFTSGGAEGAAAAIIGFAFAHSDRGPVVTLEAENPQVAGSTDELEDRGIPVLRLPRGPHGYPPPALLHEVLAGGARLLTFSLADGETGLLAPAREMIRASHEAGVAVHVEASYAFGRLRTPSLGPEALGADLVSFSVARAGGPHGAGVLLVRTGTRVRPLVPGGRQERGRRAGMENVPAVVGIAALLPLDFGSESERLRILRDSMEEALHAAIPELRIAGEGRPRLPQTSGLILAGVEAETLAIALDLEGFAVSVGMACASGSTEPAPILRALGLTAREAAGTIRVSLGWSTPPEEVEAFAGALPRVLAQARARHPSARNSG